MAAKTGYRKIARRMQRRVRREQSRWYTPMPLPELARAIEIHGEWMAEVALFNRWRYNNRYPQDPALHRCRKQRHDKDYGREKV